MSPEEFMWEVESAPDTHRSEDQVVQNYTEDEVRAASVIMRMDISFLASILGYNAKLLGSIRLGVWSLVAIGIVHLFLQYGYG